MRPTLRTMPVAVVACGALVLAGCGSSGKATPKPSSTSSADALAGVSVSGPAKAPSVRLKTKPFSVTTTSTKVVTPGNGAALTKDNAVAVNYLMVDGRDGKQIDSSYGKPVQNMDLSSAQLLVGLAKGLQGQKVGSRVLVALPPADAFGATGNPQFGIGAGDSIIFLVDLVRASTPLKVATGAAVAPKAGLPSVSVPAAGAATIGIPAKKPAPKTLVVQQLIKGSGAAVRAGQTLKVTYTGVLWRTGKKFDSSADHGGSAEFSIGTRNVIPGWDKGLVGQPVGSRVLLVVPPADGYGSTGSAAAGITGTDTLVFVVDILAAT